MSLEFLLRTTPESVQVLHSYVQGQETPVFVHIEAAEQRESAAAAALSHA